MHTVGLDIGGANLKAATSDGQAISRVFPVWQQPERLAEQLTELLAEWPSADLVAVTMTAELADCFTSKAEGVAAVLSAAVTAAAPRPVVVWQTGAEFVTPEIANEVPRLVAAANWHALATFAGRLVPSGSALLLDIGSTTTDIIPLQDGVPVPRGLTDRQRLVERELIYTGVMRTPVCAVTGEVELPEGPCSLAAEFFASTGDVHLLRGRIPETAIEGNTADGRPATMAHAAARLARMVCCDLDDLDDADIRRIADQVADAQKRQIALACQQVLDRLPGPCRHLLVAGSGSFLAQELIAEDTRLAGAQLEMLTECFSEEVAEAACAYAVARLATERAADLVTG